ncbi:hypothetical protein V6N13_143461 [Hibiscus sabdariffa]|uniref:Neprosin domain-containing protein n=1 Tax=Hibiscus sabdariffa TaxID=183260 RepID=A0ABR2FHD3_9ROSI
MNPCGTHGSVLGSTSGHIKINKYSKFAYIWVGNSHTQCPRQCVWPFYQPIYGPQTAPLIAPNNNVGFDGMGPAEAPLEASSACPGIYGKRAYPGYARNLLVDATTDASYNAYGDNGRK